MASKTVRKIQALVLGATGLFLLQKIWSGSLYFYINERFLVLTLLAALGFLALAQILIVDLFPGRKSGNPTHTSTGASDQDYQTHNLGDNLEHDHDHEHGSKRFPWALMIVALPVLLGILIPTRPLGASAIANKGLRVTAPIGTDQFDPAFLRALPPKNRTILDWLQLVGSENDPARLVGDPVDVIGFVYHDPRLADGQFLVGRFTLTCCVADAFAIGMIVEASPGSVYSENTWVRVTGTLDLAQIDNQVAPMIRTALVQPVGEPAQPYLFP